jgi:type I restriction enzyme S subunit
MPEKFKKGWRTWRFDQMAVMVNDRIDNPSEAGVDRYVGLEHLDSDSLAIRRWGAPSDVEATKLRFKAGDIILGRRRVYQRKLGVPDFDGICSAHAMVLRARPDVASQEFLSFFMQSDLFMERAKQISVGSLSPTINWKTLAAEEFALPPLDEQRRIAEVLGAADAVCTLQRYTHKTSWTVRMSAYSSITRQGTQVGSLKETYYGPAPANWVEVSIGSVLAIENRLRLPINAEERGTMPGDYGYYGPTGMIGSINKYRLDGTFALIGEDGDHFLKHKIWSMTQLVHGRFNVNNHAHVIKGTEDCLVEWFFHFFRHRDISEWLTKQGASRLKLKKSTLESMPILLPPVPEQRKLVRHLDTVAAGTEVIEARVRGSADIMQQLANRLIGTT